MLTLIYYTKNVMSISLGIIYIKLFIVCLKYIDYSLRFISYDEQVDHWSYEDKIEKFQGYVYGA